MSYSYPYCNDINLHVHGRVSEEDARRQEKTAHNILQRFKEQPGLILADEVGMGKTFVALAAATSIAVKDKRPVVVMVPPSLRDKWPRDFELFREKCLPPDIAQKVRYGRAERAVQFLKLLDDPPHRRKSIVFLTHGALTRGLSDKWVKLALIHRSLYRRKNTEKLKRALCRIMGRLLHMQWVDKRTPDIWWKLLHSDPQYWLEILQRNGIDPEGDDNPDTDDDPVPLTVIKALKKIDTNNLFDTLNNIPYKQTKYFESRLAAVRREISSDIRQLWTHCIKSLSFTLPLLVLDEAHHLKNAQTRLSSLFHLPRAKADAEEIERGPLGGVFERMLFLTATPFQLGHYELCSVLNRFGGISWKKRRAPEYGQEGFIRIVDELRKRLDAAQEAAVRLDNTWSKLKRDDLIINGQSLSSVDDWWEHALKSDIITSNTQAVINRFRQADKRMRHAEKAIRPWVIRHLRSRQLPRPYELVKRRRRFVGKSVVDGINRIETPGIEVEKAALLPFLLAARATVYAPNARPVFAEGLASSYEAFLNTRKQNEHPTDTDDEVLEKHELSDIDSIGSWYLNRLESIISTYEDGTSTSHPKLTATVQCALEHWLNGEKVLIFCHYIATGRSLRQHISHEVRRTILREGAKKLKCSETAVMDQLERIGKRFFDTDSPIRQICDKEVGLILENYHELYSHKGRLIDIVRRFLRTPTFLVRYLEFQKGNVTKEALLNAFDNKDASGLSLRRILEDFFEFLVVRCGEDERSKYIEAVHRIQSGTIAGADVMKTFGEDEIQGDRSERLIANVRLINGQTKQESRQRTMLTFNTPFFPEILIASSVMAEGVDLHLNCRHVIHHDLCWNPSTLEQRTGRIDRIGAKVERCGSPIHVYIPYIAETQDEKMYRVVIDRERWFNVVMGEQFKVDAKTTDKLAERIPLPRRAAEALAFRLEV